MPRVVVQFGQGTRFLEERLKTPFMMPEQAAKGRDELVICIDGVELSVIKLLAEPKIEIEARPPASAQGQIIAPQLENDLGFLPTQLGGGGRVGGIGSGID